jgi:hypothetical protein
MANKTSTKLLIFPIVLAVLATYFLYYSFSLSLDKHPTITTEGFTYWTTQQELDGLTPVQKRSAVESEFLSQLPNGYKFLDYYYYIKGCSLSTHHRDVTSGQHYFKTAYPTYTAIIYEYDGDFLSITPNSHKQFPFIWSRSANIRGEKNTCVLFNADMLHCGMINKVGHNRKVIQFKIVHEEDLDKLRELNNVRVEKDGKCNVSRPNELGLRFVSYHFAWFINSILTPLLQKHKKDGIGRVLQSMVPVSFYNNLMQ